MYHYLPLTLITPLYISFYTLFLLPHDVSLFTTYCHHPKIYHLLTLTVIKPRYTGWGKITSLLSVGHCEGRGVRRRVGLALKFSGIRKFDEQRAFAVKTYFSQNQSIVAVQRAFRTRYQITPRNRVPDRKSILLWVENFRGTQYRESGSLVLTFLMQTIPRLP